MFSVNRGLCTHGHATVHHPGADRPRQSHHHHCPSSHYPSNREAVRVKVPGRDFLCPPVLDDLLYQFWRGLQDELAPWEELNKIIEFRSNELIWTAEEIGLWSLEYKRELTSPLCIAAAQGFSDCLQYLLEHGARPNLVAGGRTALHEACLNSTTDCAEILLEYGANPNQCTEDGLSPLHLCKTEQSLRCAKLLVRYGADVNRMSEEEEESPLQVAAKLGLQQHVQLYLRYGAQANHQNSTGETALCAACGGARGDLEEEQEENYLKVCRFLLEYGANVNKVDKERRSPLHKAARNAQYRLVELLVERGAEINTPDYNGCSPLSNALQTAEVHHKSRPHAMVQMLLNHGSIKVWPGALLKVLSSCASTPKTVEVMFNSYDTVPVTYKWFDAIPEEAYKANPAFYASLFALENNVRCLQHHCRSALRKHFGKDCHALIPRLPIPNLLKSYLLLDPEGVVY